MMKKMLCVVMSLCAVIIGSISAWGSVAIDAEHFPDETFRNVISDTYGYGSDGILSDDEIALRTYMWDLSGLGITSLKGIEYFTELLGLNCSSNDLTELDLSANTALTELYCHYNNLTALDVSTNTSLIKLQCQYNNISDLNVSGLEALTELFCNSNDLTALDIDGDISLEILYCQDNNLTSLNLSTNTALKQLSCWNNQLTALDMSANTALTGLWCHTNDITALDLRSNTALTALQCQNNQLSALYASGLPALTECIAYSNDLTVIDVDGDTSLTILYCQDNSLTELNVSTNTALQELSCSNNQITSLDVSTNTELQKLLCSNNQLTELDVSANTALTELGCYSNKLTELDVSSNSELQQLLCSDNQLTSLDVSANTALITLGCYSNKLTELDVSSNDELQQLSCLNNRITELDISNNAALTSLWCYSNDLTALDASNNANLTHLECSPQVTTTLDVNITEDTSYPYGLNMSSLSSVFDMSRVNNLTVTDTDGAEIGYRYTTTSSTIYFAKSPAAISYTYDAQDPNNGTMKVMVTALAPLSIDITPSEQNVTAGEPIAEININADNASGDLVWSFVISGDSINLASSDNKITGTIPSSANPGTYTITVTAHDYREEIATARATIQVIEVPVPVGGITGVTITDPASKTVTLSADGGRFTASASASGTAHGEIIWETSHEGGGLTITPETSGNTASFSVSVPANTSGTAQTYTVNISAHDDGGEIFTDTLRITVNAQTFAPEPTPEPEPTPTSEPDNNNSNDDNQEDNTPSSDTGYADEYRTEITSSLRDGILRAFPNMSGGSIHQLTDSEILPGSWSVDDEDVQELSGLGERAVLNIPVIRPQNSGLYVMRLTLTDAEAGAKIALRGVSGSSSVSASELQDMDYTFLDEDGNTIDTVPNNKIVYAAMNLTAGTEVHGVVTVSSGGVQVSMAQGTVVPMELTEDEREELVTNIVESLSDVVSIDTETTNIIFVESKDIEPAPEPAPEMVTEARNDNYDIVGKLSRINATEPGLYVLKIVLSDDLFEQIQSADVDTVAIYAFTDDDGNSQVNASILNGLISTWEILTTSGHKFDKFTMKEFLMVGFLDSGQPFTLYLAKAILAVLTGGLGGCNTGLGLAGVSAVMLVALWRRRH